MKTPSNMPVSQNGFGFSINNNRVNFQFGSVLAEVSAPNVSFFCSANQMDFSEVAITNGTATIPAACTSASTYWYFFRYKMKNPGAGKYVMSNNHDFDQDSAYQYTALFINDGTRLDLSKRGLFDDVGANWMRFRHPRAYDGVTEAIRDATHNSSRLAELARYSIHAIESTSANGVIDLTLDLNLPENQGLVRLEGLENGAGDEKLPTWRYQFEPSNGQRTYSMGGWSYGQSISFEMTGVVGAIGSQTYNTYQYYTFGLGFHSPIGDPRLALVGKGGTYMQFNIKNYGGEFKNGHIGAGIHDVIMEKAAIFTQHLTTLHDPKEVDDFLWGHHLFHGVKLQRATAEMPSQENLGSNPGDTGIGREISSIKKGAPIACGDCHYRDGRGSDVIDTAFGKRIAPPVFGVGLLQYIEGREAGFTWAGTVPTVRQQIKNALVADHQIDPNNPSDISPENLELINRYTEFLTVPTRFAGVYEQPGVKEGDKLFRDIGCAGCHQPVQKTTSHAPEKFRNLTIRPYTDMKIHQVADGNYRTAPLWGLGRNIDLLENNNKLVAGDLAMGIALYGGSNQEAMDKHHMRKRPLIFLHDGRAISLKDAIVKHRNAGAKASDADAVINRFEALTAGEQENIIKFLRSL
ncbi:di-heme oxidoredictase family protein [Cellvibrio sp. OA-2007]|uniref:di-heme oxidoredictase family protein n=1 Tax=Cellvibrio sp. OA-2007 TaxID=529823 RepID=UPI001269D92E|nr:di-heme oxidoredictase family protein [Cellvibrio sp. OA-2007]